MKSSESPNLYELLRSAARPPSESTGDAPQPQPAASTPPAAVTATAEPSLQERLAAYKAAKLSTEKPAAPPPPPAAPVAPSAPVTPVVHAAPAVRAAAPAPLSPPAPKMVATPPAATPGERVLHISMNTAVFTGMIGIGLLFAAYSLGLRSGRSQASAESAVVGPKAAPVPAKTYAIRLVEWSFRTSKERLNAENLAHDVKTALDKAGHPGAQLATVQRGNETRLVIYLGRFTEPASDSSKAKLAAVRAVKVRGQPMLAQAGFEQVAP